MKQLKLSLATLAMLVAVGFSSCNKNQNAPICELEQGVLIAETSTTGTRVNGDKDNQWEGNEHIGISSKTLNASNVEYSTKSVGATASFTATAAIKVPAGTNTQELTAYYPYTADINAGEAAFQLANQTQPILWASSSQKAVTYDSPVAQFNFEHKLGKLAVKIVSDDNFAKGEPKVTVKSVIAKAILNLESGELKINPTDARADLTLTRNTNNTTDMVFQAYMAPESSMERTIVVEYNGKTYTAKPTHEIKPGVKKTFVITIKSEEKDLATNNDTIAEIVDEGEEPIDATPDAGSTPETPTTNPVTNISSADLSNSTINVEAAGKTINFNITDVDTATEKVVVKVAEDWVTASNNVTTTRAYSPVDFSLTVAENTTDAERTATVTVSIGTRFTETFTIKQAAAQESTEEKISVTSTALTLEPAATTGSIAVNLSVAGMQWEAESTDTSWLTISIEGETITYEATENTSTTERKAEINLVANDNNVTITVTQKAAAPKEVTISVNPSSITFVAENAPAQEVIVSLTNASDFSVSSDATWLTIAKDTNKFTVSAGDNVASTSTTERKATITVTAGSKTATINVTQSGKEVTPVTPPASGNALYPNGLSGIANFGTTSGITTEVLTGAGKSGGDAIKFSGSTVGKNPHIIQFVVPENMPAKPTKITFWVKGTATGKSICILNRPNGGTNASFGLGVIDNAPVECTWNKTNNYIGAITADDWVQVTLDLTSTEGVFNDLSAGAELFDFKAGTSGVYDLLFCDFQVF